MLRKGGALLLRRPFCSSSDGFSGPSQSKVKIFDRNLKRKQRDRAAWLMSPKDTLVDTVAENILDRLEDCKKTFPTALCFGGSSGAIRRLLRGRGAIEKLIMMDTSYDMLKSCQATKYDDSIETSYIVGDEEFLPIKERAGFTLPGVDMDEYTVRYKSALDLIEHLRAMGETNALVQRHKILKRETALATAAVYESMFAAEDGTIPATYQIIYMTGWREHSSQQQPKRRGSATVSFQDLQKQFGSNTSSH